MIQLKCLDRVIRNCCTVIKDDSKEITDRYAFKIDFNKMNGMLAQYDKLFHPLVFSDDNTYESKYFNFDDIQMASEYLHKPDYFDPVFDGRSQFIRFMIYCEENSSGEVLNFTDQEGNKIPGNKSYLTTDENGEKSLVYEALEKIVRKFPIYMVLVIRVFDAKKDKYDYKIYIRSNYEMVSYFKKNYESETKSQSNAQ